jgi:endonuclease III
MPFLFYVNKLIRMETTLSKEQTRELFNSLKSYKSPEEIYLDELREKINELNLYKNKSKKFHKKNKTDFEKLDKELDNLEEQVIIYSIIADKNIY